MAGTLVATTLSDGTNSTSTTNAIQGSAKAWVNFNPSAGTITASYNVSSVVTNTTGDFTVNFTTALSDAKYAVTGNSGSGAGQIITAPWGSQAAPTTTAFRVACLFYNGTYTTPSAVSLAVFR